MRCEMHKLRIIKVQDLLDLTTPFHDICILARVGIASTYLWFSDFACILNLSAIQWSLPDTVKNLGDTAIVTIKLNCPPKNSKRMFICPICLPTGIGFTT